MKLSCKNHPAKKAISFCHVCRENFCQDCLYEGRIYYYCGSSDCFAEYKKEVENKVIAASETYAKVSFRFVAYIVDIIFLFVLASIIFFPLFLLGMLNRPEHVIAEFNGFIIFQHPFTYLMGLLYFSILECNGKKSTFGKRLQGIAVVTKNGKNISFGRALARNICRLLSTITIIGYLLPIVLRKRQTLHDLICSTYVINIEVLPEIPCDRTFSCETCSASLNPNLDELIKKEIKCKHCNSVNMVTY